MNRVLLVDEAIFFAYVLRISLRFIRSEALSTDWKSFCALQSLLSGSERKTLRVSKGEKESTTVFKRSQTFSNG